MYAYVHPLGYYYIATHIKRSRLSTLYRSFECLYSSPAINIANRHGFSNEVNYEHKPKKTIQGKLAEKKVRNAKRPLGGEAPPKFFCSDVINTL